MRRDLLLAVWLGFVACKSGGAAVDPPPPPPPPAPPVSESCTPTGAACFKKAEQQSEVDARAAEESLRRCLACTDAPPAAYRLLATLQQDRGAKKEARQTLLLGVHRFPSNVTLLRASARAAMEAGNHREGIAGLAQAHRLRPNDQELTRQYEDALARHGTPEDKKEAEVQPLLLEATGRYELDDTRGALEVLKLALGKVNGMPRLRALVHHRLAVVHLGAGQLKEAKQNLEAAMREETRPTDLRAEVLLTYAEVLLSEGKLGEAEKAASSAIEIEPKNPLAHANLAIARSLAGDVKGAIRAFEQAFESGLARRLTLSDFLALGPPVEALEGHEQFVTMVKRAYPKATYPRE